MHHDEKRCVYEHWRPDLNLCFYVGRGPAKRANSLKPRERSRRHAYVVAKLERLGFCVEVRIFAGGLTVDEANALEVVRIAHYRALGHPLVNQTDGGEGLVNPSPEVREKMAARQRGKQISAEIREKMSAAKRGRKRTPEHQAKLNAAMIGRKMPPQTAEHRAKLSAAKIGRPKSEETRRRMSEGAFRREARRRAERIDRCARR